MIVRRLEYETRCAFFRVFTHIACFKCIAVLSATAVFLVSAVHGRKVFSISVLCWAEVPTYLGVPGSLLQLTHSSR